MQQLCPIEMCMVTFTMMMMMVIVLCHISSYLLFPSAGVSLGECRLLRPMRHTKVNFNCRNIGNLNKHKFVYTT